MYTRYKGGKNKHIMHFIDNNFLSQQQGVVQYADLSISKSFPTQYTVQLFIRSVVSIVNRRAYR